MCRVYAKGNGMGSRCPAMPPTDPPFSTETHPYRATVQMYGIEIGLIAASSPA